MKKSVSPLIATVLLIAFTVAIGSVVMNWGTSYIKEEQVKATSTSDVRLTCATNVNLKLMKINNLQDYCYTNDSENVTISVRLTKGTEVLKGIRVNMISNSTSETHDYSQYVEDLNFNLKIIGFSKNLINENDLIEYVELVPYIDNNGESYFCSGSSLAINDLHLCGFEISDPYIPLDLENSEISEETINETENETQTVPEHENNYFISVWDTRLTGTGSSTSNQIKLPLESSGNYSFTVDWGDETQSYIITWDQEDVTHTYFQQGEYEIKINGTIRGFTFNNLGDKLKIRDIKQWGDLRLGNSGYYFSGTENLNITAIDILNLEGTTDLYRMFYNSGISIVSNIGTWNTSNVVNMSYLFQNAKYFNSDINDWDVRNVIDMRGIFYYAEVFNQPLNRWNTSSLENMTYMFYYAKKFNQSVNNFDVSKVTNMTYVFYYAEEFDQPLYNWNFSKVEDIGVMFGETKHFNQPIGMWNTSNLRYMRSLFFDGTNFNQSINDWDTSNVESMHQVFLGAYSFNQPLYKWNTSKVKTMYGLFNYASLFNQDISMWDTSNVENMGRMFSGARSFNNSLNDWNVSNVKSMDSMFLYAIKFNQPLNKWDVGKVEYMNWMFSGHPSFHIFNQDISMWNTSSVKSMNWMFSYNDVFNQPIGNWDVSKVTDMSNMFFFGRRFNQPLGNWNVSEVVDMSRMFYAANNFNQDISSWCGKILSEPSDFATASSLQNSYKPSWISCPN
ncbi:MAG: BspA family leucine-rich repeat surface protein [Candidatus Nanoarchaeia archaeon]|nr:BspA family leucine-rich repeat surface protein [Candidatus Nanoarchaeia archaeon]